MSIGIMEYILLSGNERAHLAIAEIHKGPWIPFPWASLLTDLIGYFWLPHACLPRGLGRPAWSVPAILLYFDGSIIDTGHLAIHQKQPASCRGLA